MVTPVPKINYEQLHTILMNQAYTLHRAMQENTSQE